MTELDLITLRLRILNALLEKKHEQYHAVTLHGDMNKRHEIRKQCYDLHRVIERLEDKRRKLGGEPECK